MYLLILAYNVIYSKLVLDKKKYTCFNFMLAFVPILIVSTFLLGLQDSVGTDYFMYKKMFELGEKGWYVDFYKYKGEYIFAFFLEKIAPLVKEKQNLFLIIAFFQNYLLGIYLYETKQKYISILIFLVICLINIYQIQINVLRTSITMLIFSIVVLKLLRKEYLKVFILSIIALNIHKSYIYLFICFSFLIFILKIIQLNNKRLIIIYFLSIFLSFYLFNYIEYIITIFKNYGQFYHRNISFWRITDFKDLILKYYYSILVVISLTIRDKLSRRNKKFYDIGFICNCMRYFFMRVYLLNRINDYFLLLSIFPVYFLMIYLLKSKKYSLFIAVILYIIVPYILKVTILAEAEYLYKSILFN